MFFIQWLQPPLRRRSQNFVFFSQWLIRIKRMLCIVLIPLCPFDLLQPKHAILRDSTKLLSIITISLALLLMRSAVKQLNCSQVLF